MPVVISLLNSFTGLAAALGGFLYDNMVMLTGGILVGSAGTILTFAMCTDEIACEALSGNVGVQYPPNSVVAPSIESRFRHKRGEWRMYLHKIRWRSL